MDKYTWRVFFSFLVLNSVLFQKTRGRQVKACQSQGQCGGHFDHGLRLLWPFPFPFENYAASSCYFEDGLGAGGNNLFSERLSTSHRYQASPGCESPGSLCSYPFCTGHHEAGDQHRGGGARNETQRGVALLVDQSGASQDYHRIWKKGTEV